MTEFSSSSLANKRPAEPYASIESSFLRFLAQQGDYWGIAVNKKPKFPTGWKQEKHLLKSYNDAVGIRDKWITEGNDAVLYYVLCYTKILVLDLDPDKSTGKLRDSQLKVIEHYRSVYPAPILISCSGIGRHIYLLDSSGQLPKIGNNKVEDGSIPFEVKKDIIFITEKIEQDCQIPNIDNYAIDLVKQVKPTTRTTLVTNTNKEAKPLVATKRQLADIEKRLKWHVENKVDHPIVHDNNSFLIVVHSLKWAGYDNAGIDEFCRQQPSYKDDVPKRIASINPPTAPQYRSFIKLSNESGYSSKVTNPTSTPKDDVHEILEENEHPIHESYGKFNGFKESLKLLGIEIRYNELVGEEIKFPDKDKWLPLDDEIFAQMNVDYVAKRCFKVIVRKSGIVKLPFEVSADIRREVINSLVGDADKYNSTRNWIESIDKKYRRENWGAIDKFLDCYKIDFFDRLRNANYNEDQIKWYYRYGVLLIFGGVTLRSLKPGFPIDKFPVFCGLQGCGKGLGLALILPPEKITESGKVIPNKAFRDCCHLNNERDSWYHNRGCSLGEATELAGMSKLDNEKLKAYLSANIDYIEPKYKNWKVAHPRHFFFVGSTNIKDYKPGDETGDRRFYGMDVGSAFDNEVEVSRKLPKVLDEEWRRSAFGHTLWMIEQGYTASSNDLPSEVREMREYQMGQSSRRYQQLENVLVDIAGVILNPFRKNNSYGDDIERLADTRLIGFDQLSPCAIKEHGLPIDSPTHPPRAMTWMRLVLSWDKSLERYRDKIVVAAEHLGWKIERGQKQVGGRRARGWITPKGFDGDKPAYQSVDDTFGTVGGDESNKKSLPKMTTHEDDLAHERDANKALDDLYLRQKLGKDHNKD